MTRLLAVSALLLSAGALLAQTPEKRPVAIEWSGGKPAGRIWVDRGTLESLRVAAGKGEADASGRFSATAAGPFRLEAVITGDVGPTNPSATLVTVEPGFAFFLRDARSRYPIWLPDLKVAVTDAADRRSAVQIAAAIRARGLKTKLEAIAAAPEESFEKAASVARVEKVPTWLGLARDVRIFEIGTRFDSIQPRFHGTTGPVILDFLAGRGWNAADHLTRWIEDGALPILHGREVEEDITYELTAFVSLERSPLTAANVRGTDYLVADGYGAGHMFTPAQAAEHARRKPLEMGSLSEETVLCLGITARNTGKVPRYAFFRGPTVRRMPKDARGVFAVSLLNGKPVPQPELAVELEPGAKAEFTAYVPHSPVSEERARALAGADFARRHAECQSYWKQKLDAAASIHVPERRINEMIRAGLLHLDVVSYGKEPDGPVVPTIGVYTAIGSESSPIIQFMDSMGWHRTAERALEYFLAKQHDDGFMQNFGGYMLETGAALWSMGEHYRYTRDEAWVRRIAPKLTLACQYLDAWRQRNRRDNLRGKGYGMLEGKTADPPDLFRSFMLNGYAALGMKRVAEMLERVAPEDSRKWRAVAAELAADTRAALRESMGRSPVVPLASGEWTRTVGPWAEARGPLALYTDGGSWYTHGSMVSRDSLLGPLYAVYQEVLDARDPVSTALLNFHSDLMTENNAAFSQPYYSRHAEIHLQRGEVKAFLKAYYNTVAALADRETYTFWEHYYHASPHKTHEEAWFLMQTRQMLYRERGTTLDLLAGIPRAWLAPGKSIELQRVASYFGPVSLRVHTDATGNRIEAEVECTSDRKPKSLVLRIPHPQGKKAQNVQGGTYDAAREQVKVSDFSGKVRIVLAY